MWEFPVQVGVCKQATTHTHQPKDTLTQVHSACPRRLLRAHTHWTTVLRCSHTYESHKQRTHTSTAEAQSQMVFLCVSSLGIHQDAGDICSTGATEGVGEVRGGK